TSRTPLRAGGEKAESFLRRLEGCGTVARSRHDAARHLLDRGPRPGQRRARGGGAIALALGWQRRVLGTAGSRSGRDAVGGRGGARAERARASGGRGRRERRRGGRPARG